MLKLRAQEGGTAGYVSFFKHGVIGKGLNDYDAIFTTLKGVGFSGWYRDWETDRKSVV